MSDSPHSLFVAARRTVPTGGWWTPVGRLDRTADRGYRFVYLRGAERSDWFRPFPEMPDLRRVYESDDLFPLFANRLLSPSRPEYAAYLAWGGFDPNDPPEPIALLAVTEGLRATDNLELFACPRPDADGCYAAKLFLHGMRYVPDATLDRVERLRPGERLGMMLDISNPYDRYAVAVRTCDDRDRHLIGYVPRYLARDVHRLCQTCDPDVLSLTVERVNASAPLQHRLLCRLRCCWPEGFDPCADEAYQPIMASGPARPEAAHAGVGR